MSGPIWQTNVSGGLCKGSNNVIDQVNDVNLCGTICQGCKSDAIPVRRPSRVKISVLNGWNFYEPGAIEIDYLQLSIFIIAWRIVLQCLTGRDKDNMSPVWRPIRLAGTTRYIRYLLQVGAIRVNHKDLGSTVPGGYEGNLTIPASLQGRGRPHC